MTLTVVMCALPVAVSIMLATSGPSNSSFTINAVEWLRDHGAAGVASSVESVYYTLNAPPTGGPGLRRLQLHSHAVAAVHPPDVAPLLAPALPGEGVWTPTETWSGAGPPVQVAQFRSDPSYPQMVAAVAWIDPRRTSIILYPGRLEPSANLPRGPMEVPPTLRSRLLATFNSGFKLEDSHGGFALGGMTYAPLHDGMATFVHYSDGRVNIESWTGGPRVATGMDYARQNLPLIVSGGRPNPNLNDGPQWGATLGNAVRVWRSGIGIDGRGDLIYAAADNQTVESLAQILIHAGAIRAMQLDINSYWVTFNSYAQPNAGQPSSLLRTMTRPSTRYLSPDDRDFFAVYAK
ncbi:MAG: phosphodiester glycosidase family protein [Actinomycetota bacterium]|nr:phosphodiester glycosidase family protein [Actinomycetota bacterium]